jgi:Predicted membrane protein
MNSFGSDVTTLGIGLLVARVIIGLVMAGHGTQKLFGWFGGYGLGPTGEFMVQLGFAQGRVFAAMASIIEITSGVLVALGFLGPVGPALMISVMLVAAITVHWKNGLFATKNGIEIPLLYASAALIFAVAGFGPYSLDSMVGIHDPWVPSFTWTVIAIGILGGLGNIVLSQLGKPAPKNPK